MYSLAEQIVALNIPWPTLHLHTKIAHLRTLVNPMDKTDYPLIPGSEIAEKIVMLCSQPKQSSCAFYFDKKLIFLTGLNIVVLRLFKCIRVTKYYYHISLLSCQLILASKFLPL